MRPKAEPAPGSARTTGPAHPLLRFLTYGLVGCAVESAFSTALTARRDGRFHLHGPSTAWMLPLYGLAMPAFEVAHDRLRDRPTILRGATYATGIFAVEAASGWLLRRSTGRCPWDYSDRSPLAVAGLIRLDYAPLWATLGLAAEVLHDRLTGR